MKGKKIIIIFLGLFALLAFNNNVNAQNMQHRYTDEEIEMNHERAILAEKIDSYYKELGYPNYFGGIYITDDSKYVVIQVVKNNTLNMNKEEFDRLNDFLSMDEVKQEIVKYPYNILEETNQSLISYISNSDKLINEISAFYIDVRNNRIGIDVLPGNLSSVETIIKEKYEDFELFEIKETAKKIDKYTTTFKAGSGFRVFASTPINSYDCSVGFRAIRGNDYGFVTAGHCFSSLSGNTLTSGVGTIKVNKLSNGIDAAFVKTNSGYDVSNNIYATGGKTSILNLTIVCPWLGSGAIIAKSGRTTGYSEGQVTYPTFQEIDNGVIMLYLVGTNANASFGDSGAPVYIPTTSSSGATLAGVLRGGQPGTNYTMIFTKESQINSALGYTRY